MEEKVRTFMIENQMILPGDGIVLGLSGGADSVCLFFLLLSVRVEWKFQLVCVHVHHGIRGQAADEDEEYASQLCRKYNVPYRSYFYNVKEEAKRRGLSEEETGRILRYQSFEKVLDELGFNKIAVAHHMLDQAETVIYHLCRGSGLTGLSGIRPVSGNRIRPLLCVQKEEIILYLKKRRISWQEDATNKELHYTRNRIRSQVIPCLQENINRAAAQHIAACASYLAEADRYLAGQAKKAWACCVSKEKEKTTLWFDLEKYGCLDIVIKKQLIFMAADDLGTGRKDLTSEHLSMVLRLTEAQTGRSANLPGGLLVCREYGRLVFARSDLDKEESQNMGEVCEYLRASGTEYVLPDGKGVLLVSSPVPAEQVPIKEIAKNEENTYTKWFDYDKIKGTLQLRTRREGDYIEISKTGNRKKLKSYFIDKKVPRQLRDSIWLLADQSHVLWIIGYRISEGYKIGKSTKYAVKAEMKWR